jgi:hypothetical protein
VLLRSTAHTTRRKKSRRIAPKKLPGGKEHAVATCSESGSNPAQQPRAVSPVVPPALGAAGGCDLGGAAVPSAKSNCAFTMAPARLIDQHKSELRIERRMRTQLRRRMRTQQGADQPTPRRTKLRNGHSPGCLSAVRLGLRLPSIFRRRRSFSAGRSPAARRVAAQRGAQGGGTTPPQRFLRSLWAGEGLWAY